VKGVTADDVRDHSMTRPLCSHKVASSDTVCCHIVMMSGWDNSAAESPVVVNEWNSYSRANFNRLHAHKPYPFAVASFTVSQKVIHFGIFNVFCRILVALGTMYKKYNLKHHRSYPPTLPKNTLIPHILES